MARADFVEGSCSPQVLDQVKARRAQGGDASPETEQVRCTGYSPAVSRPCSKSCPPPVRTVPMPPRGRRNETFALQHGRLNQVLQKTPVAIAATLLTTAVWAQVADHTTSADAPEASSAFETSGQAGIGPRPFTSFLQRLASPVERIQVQVAGDNLPADGVGGTDVVVTLQDKDGRAVAGEVDVTVEVDGGARILLPGRRTSESAADKGDIDRIAPGIQSLAATACSSSNPIAPYKLEAVKLRVSVKGVSEAVTVRYVPELREMIAVGLIEGRLRSDRFDPSTIVPVREDDAFDTELKGFEKEFNGGKTRAGARAALYLKGKIKGEYLLTLAYDPDKDTDRQLFLEEVDLERLRLVYGDASIRGVDAQSTSKLYVRVDRHRSFLLYGDYTTKDDNPARSLGQYSRSLNGLQGRYEEGRVTANGFVAQDTLRQVIDEFPARGVSGPYSVSNPNGVTGSEKSRSCARSPPAHGHPQVHPADPLQRLRIRALQRPDRVPRAGAQF